MKNYTHCISDIKLELETMKVKAWKRNDQDLLDDIAMIDDLLVDIMDTKLDSAENTKCLN